MTIGKLLADKAVTIGDLARHLDGLDHAGRMEAMGSTSKAEQKRLWDLAADAAPITLEHFVPEGVPARREVIHHGRNTLPVFRSFQKRFARPEDGSRRAFGYNEGGTRPLIGPGYFVGGDASACPGAARSQWVVIRTQACGLRQRSIASMRSASSTMGFVT